MSSPRIGSHSSSRLLVDCVATLAAATVVVGGVVRLTVRDASPLWAALYYALPLVVMAALLALAGVAWLVVGRRRFGIACVAASVLLAATWVVRQSYSNPCNPRADDLRVALLNTARGYAGWYQVARVLPPFDIDIIGLVEAGSKGPSRQSFWKENFPDHDVYLPGGGLAIITRGDLKRLSLHRLEGISRYADAEIDLEGRLVRVLLVDLDASPRFDKKQLVGQVFRAAQATADIPTIVMGDFNTPIDSRWFDRIRGRFLHVFEEAGSGMLLTWPTPVPLVAIDHVWVSAKIVPTCATLESHAMSDHRLVTASLALPDEGERSDSLPDRMPDNPVE